MKPIKTFIIQHRETKEQWTSSSGKHAWKALGHAKNAWINSDHKLTVGIIPLKRRNSYREWFEYPKFDEQDVYEIIKLKPESEELLEEACKLLNRSSIYLVSGTAHLQQDIKDFLNKVKV